MPEDGVPPHAESATIAPPSGAPSWVTADLIAETIAAWQPYYAAELTADDALEMLLVVGRLFEALGDAADEKEEVPGAGPRQ